MSNEKIAIRSYKDLIVYQKAYALCIDVYAGTKEYPRNEEFGLVSQVRRAAVSIPSNIAEGYRRKNKKDYIHFLRIALGSLAEVETQVSLSIDMNFMKKEIGEAILKKAESIGQMLYKLIASLDK